MADGQSADVPTIAVLKAVEHSLCTYVVRTPALAHASHPAPQWGFSRYASSPRPAPAPAHPIERVACHGACFLRPHTTGHPGQAATPPCFAAASRPAAPSPPRMEARMRYMLHQCRSKRRRTAAAGGRYHEQAIMLVSRAQRLPATASLRGSLWDTPRRYRAPVPQNSPSPRSRAWARLCCMQTAPPRPKETRSRGGPRLRCGRGHARLCGRACLSVGTSLKWIVYPEPAPLVRDRSRLFEAFSCHWRTAANSLRAACAMY